MYQVLDLAPIVTRDAKRRGEGWLAGQADIGKSTRLGWYGGLKALVAVSPSGVLTGFGVAPASTREQPFAETFLALRAYPHPRCPSVGCAHQGRYSLQTTALKGKRIVNDGQSSMGRW